MTRPCRFCAAHWYTVALILASGGHVHPHAFGVGLHPGVEKPS